MPKKSKAVILICGAASIIVTIIFYLLTFDNIFTIPMRWTSLIFLILAEIIGTVKALNIKKSIFGLASIIVSLFHFGISISYNGQDKGLNIKYCTKQRNF